MTQVVNECLTKIATHFCYSCTLKLEHHLQIQANMMILLLFDAFPKEIVISHFDLKKIDETLGQCIKDASPSVRKTLQSWLHSSSARGDVHRSTGLLISNPADDEICPETEGVEVYPTDARMRQKEKLTGLKV